MKFNDYKTEVFKGKVKVMFFVCSFVCKYYETENFRVTFLTILLLAAVVVIDQTQRKTPSVDTVSSNNCYYLQ